MMQPTVALLAASLLLTTAVAQPATADSAVRAVVQSLEDSLNARDWEAFGSLFSEEGDFILMDSRRAIGPADVQSLIAEAWADTPADVTAKLTPVALRFVAPQVAILTVDGDFSGSQPSKDRAIFVVSNQGSGWRLEAVRVFNPEAT